MTITWTEPIGNGHDRLFQDDRSIINHTWTFLAKGSKPHHLDSGRYTYEFELPLAGSMPESTHVASFYIVQYRLKATVERPRFLPNHTTRRVIHLSRQMLPLMPEFMEPVTIANQWTDKLDYMISVPTKIYTHGDKIPISIRVTPLTDQIRVRRLSVTLKEYMICRASSGWFGGHPRAQGRVIYYARDDHFGSNATNVSGCFIVWEKTQIIPVPRTPEQVQYDVQNEAVRIRHKIKFVLSIENADGHVSELRAALPIHICMINTNGLPAYEEAWRSVPYNPSTMINLLLQENNAASQAAPASQTSHAEAAAAAVPVPPDGRLRRRAQHEGSRRQRRRWSRSSWLILGTSNIVHNEENEPPPVAGDASPETTDTTQHPLPSYSSVISSCNDIALPSSQLPSYDDVTCP
ncbi:hypothetical protein BCR43DRAFT_498416 [Syncephalastrum racemosum]|uniref:Arrestin C-terminal-like domain-containing protein n=1 Tax=Syncephalastrum racemosum TaxID=13706 RepID=A0A1X2H109_SYNRA|nr:hypothetical protein BCR43DRAFT_498416 [Syncephalastrum racemosum]